MAYLAEMGQLASPSFRALLSTASPDEEGHGGEVILFMMFAIVLGLFSRRVLQYVPVPYTGLLMIWGLGIGFLNANIHSTGWHHAAIGIQRWTGMPPTLLLLIFLPVLIFASGFSMDWHMVSKLKWQMLILAGPGVIVGTILLALVAKFVLPYGWSWDNAILYGAMLSATDPVAVVALLKEVGASKDLGTLIEGESLLNDGTAFVLFMLFLRRVEGNQDSVGTMVATFAQLALGGPATGLLFGIVTVILLSLIYNDELAEIALTIASSFLCFYIGEDIFKVSGVLAVVFLGVYMAAVGKTRVSPKSEHALHIVWEMFEFLANTLIFVFSGVVIATEFSTMKLTNVLEHGIGWGVLIYVFANLSRFVMVFMFFPIFKFTGYSMDVSRAIIISWGGLRGAVGLALALIVVLDTQIVDQDEYKSIVLLHMGTMAVLTLLVNGSLTPLFLRLVGLSKITPAKRRFANMAMREVEAITQTKAYLRFGNIDGDPDWEVVKRGASVAPAGANAAPAAGVDRVPDKSVSKKVATDEGNYLADVRQTYLSVVKSSYAEGFEKEYIKASHIYTLNEAADSALDRCHDTAELDDLTTIEENDLTMPFMLRITNGKWLDKVWGARGVWNYFLFGYVEYSITLLSSYLYAHKEAAAKVFALKDKIASEGGSEEVRAAYDTVLAESKHLISRVTRDIRSIRLGFPDMMTVVKTARVTRTILMHKERYLNKLEHTGLCEPKDIASIRSELDRKIAALHHGWRVGVLRPAKQLLHRSALFHALSEEAFERTVVPLAQLKVANKGQLVYTGASEGKVIIVLRGICSSILPDEEDGTEGAHEGSSRKDLVQRQISRFKTTKDATSSLAEDIQSRSVIGLDDLLCPSFPGANTRYYAETVVEAAHIAVGDLLRIFETEPAVVAAAIRLMAIEVALQFGPEMIAKFDKTWISEFIEKGAILFTPSNQHVSIAQGSTLIVVSGGFHVPRAGEDGSVEMFASPGFFSTSEYEELIAADSAPFSMAVALSSDWLEKMSSRRVEVIGGGKSSSMSGVLTRWKQTGGGKKMSKEELTKAAVTSWKMKRKTSVNAAPAGLGAAPSTAPTAGNGTETDETTEAEVVRIDEEAADGQ